MGIWVPHTFCEKNKKIVYPQQQDFFQGREMTSFLKNIITGNEKWVFYDNV